MAIRRAKKIAAVAGLVVLVVAGGFFYVIWGMAEWADRANVLVAPVTFDVVPGSTFGQISRELEYRFVVDSAEKLVWLARWNNATELVHVGEYQFEPGETPKEVLRRLISGLTIVHKLRILEGWRLQDALELLRTAPALTRVLEGIAIKDLLGKVIRSDGVTDLFNTAEHSEGLFFPDTYYYRKGSTDLDILRRSYQKLQSVMESEWRERQPRLPYGDAYEALIMASIIEKETGLRAERKKIGGVFVRRLRRSMLLQTDPTVIYGLGANFAGNLTRQHLEQDGPYNTYKRRGLPPSPIALAGRASIHAALHPESGTAMYFVGRGDGTSHFSDTLEDHLIAVRRYQQVKAL